MEIIRKMKKSAIGGTSVTLVPSTTGGSGEGHPTDQANFTQIVFTTPSTPPAAFWGTVTTDGFEYELILRRVS